MINRITLLILVIFAMIGLFNTVEYFFKLVNNINMPSTCLYCKTALDNTLEIKND